jgi:hypothetical protein
VSETPAGAGESGSEPTEVIFEESEVEPIVGSPPGYEGVIVFEESEVEPIVARPAAYEEVIFEESEVEPIIGNPPIIGDPSGYEEVVFEESEVEPIVGRRPSYEDVIVFEESEVEPIVARPLGYGEIVYGDVIAFEESEVEPFIAPPPGRVSRLSDVLRSGSIVPPVSATGPDRPSWWPEATGISFELMDAWELPPPVGVAAEELPLASTQVLSWLQKYGDVIAAAERQWRVDRRAIAAAIAWEALVNVRTASLRAVGPGKVHVNSEVVREVEAAGYLPRQTPEARRELLRTPEGAIQYIAAIMHAKANIAEAFGFNIRNRVDILTNEYQGRSLTEWTDVLINKRDTALVAGNSMGIWAPQHIQYLELGVGGSDVGALLAPPPP